MSLCLNIFFWFLLEKVFWYDIVEIYNRIYERKRKVSGSRERRRNWQRPLELHILIVLINYSCVYGWNGNGTIVELYCSITIATVQFRTVLQSAMKTSKFFFKKIHLQTHGRQVIITRAYAALYHWAIYGGAGKQWVCRWNFFWKSHKSLLQTAAQYEVAL